MKNPRIQRNANIRTDINTIITNTPPGTLVYTDNISRELNTRRRNVTNRNVGNFLDERDDINLVGKGVWQKLPINPQDPAKPKYHRQFNKRAYRIRIGELKPVEYTDTIEQAIKRANL